MGLLWAASSTLSRPAGRRHASRIFFLGGLGQEVSGRDRRRSQETMRAGIVGFVTRRFKEREREREEKKLNMPAVENGRTELKT